MMKRILIAGLTVLALVAGAAGCAAAPPPAPTGSSAFAVTPAYAKKVCQALTGGKVELRPVTEIRDVKLSYTSNSVTYTTTSGKRVKQLAANKDTINRAKAFNAELKKYGANRAPAIAAFVQCGKGKKRGQTFVIAYTAHLAG